MTPSQALREAIRLAGGLSALAKHLKITKQAILVWKKTPARHVLKIEELTGVSRHELRPDLYPNE